MRAVAITLLVALVFILTPFYAYAQTNVSAGGTGTTTLPAGSFWIGSTAVRAVNTGARLVFDYATGVLSSTAASITALTLPVQTSTLLLTDSGGSVGSYPGTTCTNEFIRALDFVGAATCDPIDLASDITGILAIANGGTNANNANDALNNLIPSQGSHSGEFLTTDGSNTAWAAVPSGGGGGLATTSPWVSGELAWVVNEATVSSVTTTTLGGTGAISVSNSPFVLGGSGAVISCATASGSVSGCLSTTDWNTFNNKGSGTVTAVSVASANGFAGSSSGGATPQLTLSTTITGLLKGNGTAISAASAGTDYVAGGTGANTQITYFTGSGAIEGDTGMTYNATDDRLTVVNATTTSLSSSGGAWLATSGANVGIGTTTPWGTLSIASSTPYYTNPIFTVATSTDRWGSLVSVFATTTSQNPIARISGDLSAVLQNGVRVVIGMFTESGRLALDPLNVDGAISTGDWFQTECTGGYGRTAGVVADTATWCGTGWMFQEDFNGAANPPLSTGGTRGAFMIAAGSPGSSPAAAGDGAGVFFGGAHNTAAGSFLSGATTTPWMEAAVSMNAFTSATGNSATSTMNLGFFNINPLGTAFDTGPTIGCYFTASTTQANFVGVCRTSAANVSLIDTGIASTSVEYTRMRVEMDNTEGRFYVQSTSSAMRLIGKVSGANYPANDYLNAGIITTRAGTGGLATRVFIKYIRLAYRNTLWGN